MKNIPIIIQARQSSKRLPSKVMTNFCSGLKMIEYQYNRLKNNYNNVVIATSTCNSDDEMCKYFEEKGIRYYRGSLNNVMKRLLDCFDNLSEPAEEWFVRVGGDDPMVSIEGIEIMFDKLKHGYINKDIDMYYSSYDGGMMYGCAVEMFRVEKYREVVKYLNDQQEEESRKNFFQEHTKPAFLDQIVTNKLRIKTMRADIPEKYRVDGVWLSIDYPEDFLLVSHLATKVVSENGFNYTHEDLIRTIHKTNNRLFINKGIHDGFGE